ncbi:dihydroxyacetone kinase subunit DhaL [Rhodopila sp.]|uniref:dihydroxyacetone kinase subunit DhaL n=1 Tax=Rhodopila sp. TaxID=2480087 RepID=UPI003D0A7321
MDSISEQDAGPLVLEMAAVIVREQAFLSEIDGKIGDGDHGINMSKGFRLAAERLRAGGPFGLAHGLQTLGDTLLGDIGGSMGPLYGTCFTEMAGALEGAGEIDAARFAATLRAGYAAVIDLGGARPGDKTLVDVLEPAVTAFEAAHARGEPFAGSLASMKQAAASGLASTRDMVARIGRASRLGERSRGTLDAGAASCNLLLATLADGLTQLLHDQQGASQ